LPAVSDQLDVTIQNVVSAFTIEITEGGSTTLTTPVTEGDNTTYGVQTTGDTTNVTYSWSVSGGTINSGQGTSSVNVTWDNPTTGGYIQVNAFRNVTEFLASDNEAIVVNAAAAPTFVIDITNVTTPVLEEDVVTYGTSVTGTATGTITYSWTVVGGSFSGQGSDAITVVWDTPGTGSVRVDALREGIGASDQDAIEVTALETTVAITGDFTDIAIGGSRSYGSTIGGNTTGTVTYAWSVSGGTITSGQGTSTVDVDWNVKGTGILSLVATRQSRTGSDSGSLTVLPIYYRFEKCDGGLLVFAELDAEPTLNDRYVDAYSNRYVYIGPFTTQPGTIETLYGPTGTDCVDPAPDPSILTITGDQDISGLGETGIVYNLEVTPDTVQWVLSDAALSGYNPIDITFVTSTSGTGDSTFTVNYGAYTGNGTETLRSVITATEQNPTSPNPASSGSIVISQSPPPTATLNVYARANLLDASRTFSYSTGGSYLTIATASLSTSCTLIGTVTGLTPGATVTIVTTPTNLLKGNDTSSCPGDFTSPSEGATSYSITVVEGSNDVSFNVDTVATTYALTTGRSTVDSTTACNRYNSGFTGTTYADEATLFGSTALFGDANGYTYASPAWYSDGIDVRYWDGTAFTSTTTC